MVGVLVRVCRRNLAFESAASILRDSGNLLRWSEYRHEEIKSQERTSTYRGFDSTEVRFREEETETT